MKAVAHETNGIRGMKRRVDAGCPTLSGMFTRSSGPVLGRAMTDSRFGSRTCGPLDGRGGPCLSRLSPNAAIEEMLNELGAALRKSGFWLPSLAGHGFWTPAAWADNSPPAARLAPHNWCNPRPDCECGTICGTNVWHSQQHVGSDRLFARSWCWPESIIPIISLICLTKPLRQRTPPNKSPNVSVPSS
jgi:hypothetical protein